MKMQRKTRRPVSFDALESRRLFTVFNPATAAAFSSALSSAQLGDTIILNAGTTYVGSFSLANKTTGSGFITIQSSNLAQLPAAGVRVSPADAANMPIIQAPGSNAQAIKTQAGAHHFQFVGIEFVGPSNNSSLTTLIELGNDSQSTLDAVPNHINIDRCYMRPNTPVQTIRRAIGLHTDYTDITNSYIEEIHEGSDSNAIGAWNGVGHYNIINNHLEGAGENILVGGATNHLPESVSDVVIRGNHVIKPLYWRDGSRGYKPTVKNLFELKEGRRFTVEDNIFENCWTSGQTGVAILIKLAEYDVSPQNLTEDLIFRNNIVRHANGGVTLQGRDYENNSPPGLVRRLSFTNNLFYDITNAWTSAGGIGGNFLYLTHGPIDVTFDHNTIINGRTILDIDTPQYPATNFKFTNNILAHNTYGVHSTDGTGNFVFAGGANGGQYFGDPGNVFTKNILMGGNANSYTDRPGNFFPATWTAVGFTDQANNNYKLLPTSAYHNAGTDGKDVGVDTSLLPFEFASVSGTTLNVNFRTDAPMPIKLTASGTGVTAEYDGEILPFVNIASIAGTGTAGDDLLQLSGTSTLPITYTSATGNDLIEVLDGSSVLANDVGGAARNVAVTVDSSASATFNATQHLRSLAVVGTATLSSGGNKVLVTKALSLTGKLNLTDNDFVLDYSGASPMGSWNGSAYTGIEGLVASGRHDGDYLGNGFITDRSAALSGSTTLAVAEASNALGTDATTTALFSSETVDGTAILVKYTYAGDANLDGTINPDDYALVSFNDGNPNAHGYFNGDFNFDGDINADDFALIDFNFNSQGAPL